MIVRNLPGYICLILAYAFLCPQAFANQRIDSIREVLVEKLGSSFESYRFDLLTGYNFQHTRSEHIRETLDVLLSLKIATEKEIIKILEEKPTTFFTLRGDKLKVLLSLSHFLYGRNKTKDLLKYRLSVFVSQSSFFQTLSNGGYSPIFDDSGLKDGNISKNEYKSVIFALTELLKRKPNHSLASEDEVDEILQQHDAYYFLTGLFAGGDPKLVRNNVAVFSPVSHRRRTENTLIQFLRENNQYQIDLLLYETKKWNTFSPEAFLEIVKALRENRIPQGWLQNVYDRMPKWVESVTQTVSKDLGNPKKRNHILNCIEELGKMAFEKENP